MNFSCHRILILICLFLLIFTSCNSYYVSWDNYRKNEILYYDLNDKDTILDVSSGNTFFDPFLSTTTNHLHFYLTFLHSSKIKSKNVDSKFKEYSKRYAPENKASFTLIQNTEDTILLHSNSVDKILCRNRLYDFKNLENVTHEFYRLLKSNGTLIITQEEFKINNDDIEKLRGKPLPKEKDIITYFESNGFKFEKSREIVLNKRSGPNKLIHFIKR